MHQHPRIARTENEAVEALRQSLDGTSNLEGANCHGLRFDSLSGVKPRQAIATGVVSVDVDEVMKLRCPKRIIDPNSRRRDIRGVAYHRRMTNLLEEIPFENPLTRVPG
jgi:hypothetical protein